MKRTIVRGLLIAFATLGVIFLVTLFGIAIFPDTEQRAPLTLTAPPAPAGSPLFLETLSHLTNDPVGEGGAVTVVPDSVFLPALLNSIANASSSIDITDYPWAGGSFSGQLFAALTSAAKRGVAVRVLLDSFGANTLPQSTIQPLEQAGGKVAWYHPFSFFNPIQYDERDHMRAFVIDGKVGYIGGVGIVDYWITNASGFSQWNDLMFEMNGSMAQAVQGDFAELWSETTGEVLSGPEFYPTIGPAQQAETNSFISIASLPSENAEPVRDAFMLTALSAQKKLYIINPYIIPDQGFLDVLEAKARAGVDVRILSTGNITTASFLRSAWQGDYQQLLEAGVKIYEYQPAMMHTKMMMADDAWSVIGSANIDNRSDVLNAENIMGIADPALATQLDQIFLQDMQQSKQITLSEWQQQYGFTSRIASDFWLIFFKQL